MIKAGELDRRIVLMTRTQGQNTSGRPTIVWADGNEIWAQVRDMLPSRGEQIADGINVASRPARIRVRYRDDISADMRIRYGDQTLQIVSEVAELGRQEGLEFMAEEIQPKGEEP